MNALVDEYDAAWRQFMNSDESTVGSAMERRDRAQEAILSALVDTPPKMARPFWISIDDRLPDVDAGTVFAARVGRHVFVETVTAREIVHYTEESKRLNETPIWNVWAPVPPFPDSAPEEHRP